MTNAKLGKEIVIEVTNEIGILNRICKLVAEKGVNVVAVHGSVHGEAAIIRLVTTDNLRVGDALRAQKYAPHEEDCVLVTLPNKPGILRNITQTLGEEQIDLHHIYATATGDDGTSLVAFSSSNNDRSLVLLNHKN